MSRDQDRVQRFHSGGPWETEVGYSRAIRVGDRVLVSGTTAARGDEAIPEDAGEQARVALETIEHALEQAGSELRDVIRTRVFVVDLPENGQAVLDAYRELLAQDRSFIVPIVGSISELQLTSAQRESFLSLIEGSLAVVDDTGTREKAVCFIRH